MTTAAVRNARGAALRKVQTQIVPETAAFAFVALMTAQLPEVGPLLMLAQLGLFALLVAARPTEALQVFLRWWPIMLAPIIAFISFAWSDMPAASARYGFQLLFTAYVGVLLANLVPPHRFVAMVFLSMLVFCLLSIASRRFGPSVEGLVMIGFTGSKNQMALAGYTLMLSAVAVALIKDLPRWMRFTAALGALVALYILARTSSATALVVTAAAVPALLLMHLSQRMPIAARFAILGFAIIVAIPVIFLAPEIEAALNHFLFDVLGKDPTLTGRTYLWERADELIARRPLLGYGYQSFWIGESPDALAILNWAGVTDGRTFHFHNTYLQVGVDTGYVGMIAFAGAMAAILFAGMRQYVFSPSTATSFMFVSFLAIAALSFTELVLSPMLPRTLFLFAAGVYALQRTQGAPAPVRRIYRKSWAPV